MQERERILTILEPTLVERGLDLVDVEFHREGRGPVLRLIVDRSGGVDLDGLADLSREVSDLLDVANPVDQTYTLEVTSPGINRPLRTPDHFRRFVDSRVRLRTRAPIGQQRNFLGRLVRVEEGGVTILEESGRGEVFVAFAEVEKANYEHDFTAADFGKGRSPKGARTAPAVAS